jgi:hypothetical protein
MFKDKQCPRCGWLNEFLYEIDGVEFFYCAKCNAGTKSTHEPYGPNEKATDEAGR